MIKVKMEKPDYPLAKIRKNVMSNKSFQLPKEVFFKIKNNLMKNFKNKCAYCESINFSSFMEIDNYRPKDGSRNSDGTVSKEHYWWLKYEWDNLLPICSQCSRNKSNRFPVFSYRASVGTFEKKELDGELPALLHPYYDDPEEYFIYSEDGYVYSQNKRASVTIEILNLNRISLVDQRKMKFNQLDRQWTTLVKLYNMTLNEKNSQVERILDEVIYEIKSGLQDGEEFCGMKRQFVRFWIHDFPQLRDFLYSRESYFSFLYNKLPEVIIKENIRDLQFFRESKKTNDNYDINKHDDREKYFSRRRHIERIVISNFRTIKNLDITISLGESNKFSATWLMLLGENGTGKSTILHAIALTLMDNESRKKYVRDASSVLKNGTEEGFISVYFSGSYEPITIKFRKDRVDFFGEYSNFQKVIMLGYGSTRLLPKRTSRKKDNFGLLRVDNLFNPLFFLVNASRHLYQLEQNEFEEYIRIIKSLLLLKNVSISRDPNIKNRIILKYRNQDAVSLDELSDGYRSMLALAVDIIMALKYLNWNPDDGEAIVLIDELDAHLHPQWILQIVTLLRKTFPNIQFIVTSHDPLCLRGLEQNEILVLRRDIENEVFIEKELPPQEFLEVDRLLKYQFFGLSTTLDPQTDADFKEYYKLLVEANRTDKEEEQLKVIRKKLITNNYLGKTPREQMMYDVIDEYMAKTQYNPLRNLVHIKEETKQKLRDIITYVEKEDTTDDSH